MRYLMMCFTFTVLGFFIGYVNKQEVFKEHKKIDKVFKGLESLIVNYTGLVILISLMINIWVGYTEVIKCVGLDDETEKNRSTVSVVTKIAEINWDIVAKTGGTLGTLKLGINFAKNFPTPMGKAFAVGYVTAVGTASMYMLNKDRKYKNEEIEIVTAKGEGIKVDKEVTENGVVINKVKVDKEVTENGVVIENEVKVDNSHYREELGKEVINKTTENEEALLELIMDIFYLNTFAMVGQWFLLHAFVVMTLKGKEKTIVKYIPFIKRKDKLEEWIKWYINKRVGFTSWVFIIIWISIFILLLLIKYRIVLELWS